MTQRAILFVLLLTTSCGLIALPADIWCIGQARGHRGNVASNLGRTPGGFGIRELGAGTMGQLDSVFAASIVVTATQNAEKKLEFSLREALATAQIGDAWQLGFGQAVVQQLTLEDSDLRTLPILETPHAFASFGLGSKAGFFLHKTGSGRALVGEIALTNGESDSFYPDGSLNLTLGQTLGRLGWKIDLNPMMAEFNYDDQPMAGFRGGAEVRLNDAHGAPNVLMVARLGQGFYQDVTELFGAPNRKIQRVAGQLYLAQEVPFPGLPCPLRPYVCVEGLDKAANYTEDLRWIWLQGGISTRPTANLHLTLGGETVLRHPDDQPNENWCLLFRCTAEFPR